MTLNGRYAFCSSKDAYFGAHHKKLNDIDPYCQRQKCRPLTLVSGDIKFVRIFAAVLWRGGVKRQWGNRKRRFSWLLDATSSGGASYRQGRAFSFGPYLGPYHSARKPKKSNLRGPQSCCPERSFWVFTRKPSWRKGTRATAVREWRPLAKKSTVNQWYAISYWWLIVTVATLLTVCEIFSCVEVENRHFRHCILNVDP